MLFFSRKPMTLLLVAMLAMLSIGSVAAQTPDEDAGYPPANDAFLQTWGRLDYPTATSEVDRTWMWGPSANTEALSEPYVDSPGGERQVQYYDKSRMEINHPDAEPGLWYVTNGLLVVELITGQMQMGDNTFEPHQPAEIPVAGDADDTTGPTYAALGAVLDAPPHEVGETITDHIDRVGSFSSNADLANYGVTAAYLDEVTNHTIASPFWSFMNSSGVVYQNDAFVTGQLFEDPFYATGRPITEAYWATVQLEGETSDVLLQCFERRCLTFTPDNPEGWQVEAGNVGRHYYSWRYDQSEPPTETAVVYLVALGDEGQSGTEIGCGDSLIPVEIQISPDQEPVTQALEQLFAFDPEDGESGLYNALNQDLAVESVNVENGHATVEISGEYLISGTCDAPRFIEQLRQTVLQFDEITSADITVAGTPLEDVFDMS